MAEDGKKAPADESVFTKTQLADFKEAFEVFDADGSGDIDTSEIAAVLKSLGQPPSDEDLAALMKGVGKDTSDTISWDDFLKLMTNLKKLDKTWELLLNFSKAQLSEYRDAFNMFDTDGSGDIDTSELGALLKALGQSPNEAELKEMVKEVDADGSGSIEFNEFLALMTKRMEGSSNEDDIAEAFKLYDRDNNGFISVANLQYMLTTLGEKFSDDDVKEMLLEADSDGDGKVNYKDFHKMMTASA
eukprot:gb/GFBE01016891.1/.p1 GENE.gb/GFBE01016891.1/~~gb/GFBE01016891.1/.p1  ORF type:complete len:245 (+),score=84.48 gb/GFBE01016891.1/:1-735(+)